MEKIRDENVEIFAKFARVGDTEFFELRAFVEGIDGLVGDFRAFFVVVSFYFERFEGFAELLGQNVYDFVSYFGAVIHLNGTKFKFGVFETFEAFVR